MYPNISSTIFFILSWMFNTYCFIESVQKYFWYFWIFKLNIFQRWITHQTMWKLPKFCMSVQKSPHYILDYYFRQKQKWNVCEKETSATVSVRRRMVTALQLFSETFLSNFSSTLQIVYLRLINPTKHWLV